MKLATVFGASFWKNWQVMRPIDVSITTVGPLGTMLAAAVAWGASGSGSCAGGLDCCDRHAAVNTIPAANDEVRKAFLNVIPNSRVNHRTEMLPRGKRCHPRPIGRPPDMYRSCMRNCSVGNAPSVFAVACVLSCLSFGFRPAFAQEDHKPAASGEKAAAEKPADKAALPPLPADAHVQQEIKLDGKALKYTVTVSAIPVRDKDGKVAGQVVTTAYTVDGENRPVTFAFNGGPGASSVFLNFGAIGPRHMSAGNEGDSPSDPAVLADNPGTWLDFTDLVFVDPIGTGFSRAEVPEDQARKLFFSTTPDIQYLSRVIFDWLVKNSRLGSRKYLVGESYGGFRGPRITHYLQSQLGVALNGVVLVSPYLNPEENNNGDLSPLPWMMTLPSITAAHMEREKKLTPETMAEVIAYTRGE